MPTANEPYTIFDRGWILRLRPPQNLAASSRILLLLHGWTGDENVMWIFARGASPDAWIYAPRGPIQAPDGGYGWLPHAEKLPTLADFSRVASDLMDAYVRWTSEAQVAHLPVDVMGFSQGAAMAYALAAFYPEKIARVIALAGFLPSDETRPGGYDVLQDKPIYIAHGTKDATIPVGLARSAVSRLQSSGARVTYCESDTGHKLSASCLKSLDAFLSAKLYAG